MSKKYYAKNYSSTNRADSINRSKAISYREGLYFYPISISTSFCFSVISYKELENWIGYSLSLFLFFLSGFLIFKFYKLLRKSEP